MKLTKLMLSAFVAALALTACKKDEMPEITDSKLKSVEVSLENLVFTKGLAGEKVEAGDPVKINNFTIYLTDGVDFYPGYEADGATLATSSWTASALVDYIATGQVCHFHYVDPKVTTVVAVANWAGTATDLADLKSKTLNVGDQQNAQNLVLYAESGLTKSGSHSVEYPVGSGIVNKNDLYVAEVTLAPRVSRFEVDGFSIQFGIDDPATVEVESNKYENITIDQLTLTNYMPVTGLWNGTESGTLVNPYTFTNEVQVYDQLAANNLLSPLPWNVDLFSLSFDQDDAPATGILPKDITGAHGHVGEKTPLAYHVFAGEVIPQFVIHLTADGVPAFLYTKLLKNGTSPISALEEGMIYRMSAAGATDTSSGNILIDEDDIEPMARCIDITVKVVPWQVVLVTPQF